MKKSVALLTLAWCGFIFVVVTILYNGVMTLIIKETGLGIRRFKQATEHVPTIADNPTSKKIVIVYGSSLIRAGFSPDTFDSEMDKRGFDTISYNFGFDGLNPEYQHLYAKRIKDEFQRKGRKIDTVLVELNPFQTTLTRKDHDQSMSDQWHAIFCTPTELWDITTEDPQRGVRLFSIRYLKNGVSSELITSALRLALKLHDPTLTSKDYAEVVKQRRHIKKHLNLQLKIDLGELYGNQWNFTFRGARMSRRYLSQKTLNLHEKLMNSLRHPIRLEQDLKKRIKFCDIVKLRFDDKLIDEFIKMVHTFQSVSHQVEVILLPQNHQWIQYSLKTKNRLNQVFNRIVTETGAPVKNYQNSPEINANHFSDTTHLTPISGSEVFTRLLARNMAIQSSLASD